MAVTDYTLPRPDYNFSKNEILVGLQTDIDVILYAVRIRIAITITWMGTAYVFYNEEVPDEDGKVLFDVGGIIDDTMKSLFTAPSPTASGIILVQDAPVLFSIDYTEYKDDVVETTGTVNDFNNSGLPYEAIKGGVSSEFISLKTSISDRFFTVSDGPENIPFLTWQPIKLIVDKNQLCPLYYLNTSACEFLRIKLRVYAGTTEIIGAPVDYIYDTAPEGIFMFHAGWKTLDIDTMIAGDPDEDNVTHYTVQLMDSVFNPISELRTFYLDNAYHANKTYLIFENSLNGFDDIRLLGEIVTKSDYDRRVSVMTGVSEINPLEGTRVTSSVMEQFGKKINTGYLSPKECNALRETLLSVRMFEIIDNDRMLAIEWNERSKEILKSNDNLNGIPLEFIYTTKNRVFTSNPAER